MTTRKRAHGERLSTAQPPRQPPHGLSAEDIDAALRAAGQPERAEQEKRYLKSDLTHYGTTVPAIRRVAKSAFASATVPARENLLATVRALWAHQVHECRMATVELLKLGLDLLRPTDLDLLERLIRQSRTWALVDGLSANVAGPLVERYPELEPTLERWSSDGDFWIRRAALLAHLLALRRGEGDFERFSRFADSMLDEREFFIRKAIGWVLRATARQRPDMVFSWLVPRARRLSGVTAREAVKYLSADQCDAIDTARGRGLRA